MTLHTCYLRHSCITTLLSFSIITQQYSSTHSLPSVEPKHNSKLHQRKKKKKMNTSISFYLLISSFLLITVNSDIASDRAECTNPLMGLATCLPYVQGSSKSPTPDCCTGLKQVLVDNKKCLCVLIRDRDDPQLGIKLNASRALDLPATCAAKANISHCPELLNIDPNSKDAAIFEQGGTGGTAATPAVANSTSSNASGKSSKTNSAATKESNGAASSILSSESSFLVQLVVGFGISIIVPLITSS